MSLCGVVGVDDLLLLASRGGRLRGSESHSQALYRAVREKVAGRVGAVGDECENLRDEALLHAGLELGIKLGQARLTRIVEDQDGVDHGGLMTVCVAASLRVGLELQNAGCAAGAESWRRGPSFHLLVLLVQTTSSASHHCTGSIANADPSSGQFLMNSLSRSGSAAFRRAVRAPFRIRPAHGSIARSSVALSCNRGGVCSASSARSFHVSIVVRGIMPDAKNPAPRQPEDSDHPTVPTDISTSEYHERADAYLDELVTRLEEKQEQSPDFEVEYSVRPSLAPARQLHG